MSINIPWPPTPRENFLFGDARKSFLSETEYIFLIIKYYIWVSRCMKNDLAIEALKNTIRSNINLDLHFYGSRGGGGQLINTNERFLFLSTLADKMGIG